MSDHSIAVTFLHFNFIFCFDDGNACLYFKIGKPVAGARVLVVGRKFMDLDDKYASVIVDELTVWDKQLSEPDIIRLRDA